jgi:hypothetical protein
MSVDWNEMQQLMYPIKNYEALQKRWHYSFGILGYAVQDFKIACTERLISRENSESNLRM